jgi:hypothetical protein
MSYSTVLRVYPNDRVEQLEELRNGWLSAPLIWDRVWNRYGEKRHEYDQAMVAGERLWALQRDPRLEHSERVVFCLTFDRFIVLRQDFERLAADIEAVDLTGHWPRICEILRAERDAPALGFWWTSVADNPLEGPWDEEAEEYGPPDWTTVINVYDHVANLERTIGSVEA